MGDGSSSVPKRDPGTVFVALATVNYSITSIERIERALRAIGINNTGRQFSSKGDAGINVSVLQDDVNKFMSIIAPYMLPSYKYKVKYKKGERYVDRR